MAGTYPDVPGPRWAYDMDGTAVLRISATNQITVLTPTEIKALNDESSSTKSTPVGTTTVFIPPSPVCLYGVYVNQNETISHKSTVSTSNNTTNGVDGTWTAYTSFASNPVTIPSYRSTIFSAAPVNGVRAIKVGSTYTAINYLLGRIHIYAEPDASSDRLVFWHPTLDQPLSATPAHFDYGDVPQNSAPITRSFRLKNTSSTLSANNILVRCEAPTDSAPVTYVSQTQFRYSGSSFGATAPLATLAPGAVSDIFDVRLSVSNTASLSVWAQRYVAEAAHWS